MSKRVRLFTIILVLFICGVFLYPTFKWYFITPNEEKELSTGSREQIREYSFEHANKDIAYISGLALSDPDKPVPEDLYYLIDIAKANYKLDKKSLPDSWSVSDILKAFRTKDEASRAIEDYYRNKLLGLKEKSGKILQLGLDLSGGMNILLQADMESLEQRLGHYPTKLEQNQAIDRAMEILNNRIDKFGVTEPQIRRQGDDQIIIEIPGAADPDRVNSFLMGKGSLSFHIVNDEETAKWIEYKSTHSDILLDKDGHPSNPNILEAGFIVRGFYTKDSYGMDEYIKDLVIYEEVGLDGNHIIDAQVGKDPLTGKPIINFSLDKEGGEIFFQLTSSHTKKTLAIVLDDKIKAGARISEPIRGNVRMTGFDKTEAANLALVLRTAAMPVDLKINNQQAIGASLGEDSINRGLKAMTLGFILVIIFMLLYYKAAGFIADIALILNLFFIIAILSAFNLTLTLTSIAGLILTVGMAVDANVIIFERIKEEYRLGKSPEASIKAGFRKAFWTIMDANITTFIAALFLSQLGKGPVQGFAYTLAVGIVSSMFTALFVSRLIFDFGIEVMRIKKLSIGWRIK